MAKKPVVVKRSTKQQLSWAALVKLDKEEHGAEDAEWARYLAHSRVAAPAVDKDDMIEYVPCMPCYCP
jgi:hypothetical protein